jgi:hypothetical protein
MDVFLYPLVGSLYRRAVEWWTRGEIRHDGSGDCDLLAKKHPVRWVVRL